MSYQRVTGPLMANSHPGSYCGQDAYNGMLVTDELQLSRLWDVQGIGPGIESQTKRLQRCNGSNFEGGGITWIR